MKNKFGKIMVLGLFIMIFLVACINATESGRIEGYYIGDGGFVVSKKSENFVPGDLIIASNKTDQEGLIFGQNYSILVDDELPTITPPSFKIKSISEDLGRFEYLNMSFVKAASIMGVYADKYYLVDLRDPEEYETGHVPGAINISLADVEAGQSLEELDRKDQMVFVYGKSQRQARDGARALRGLDYKIVFDLGEIKGYKNQLEK